MRLRLAVPALLAGVLAVAGCADDGPPPAAERAARWQQAGDAAFAERNWERAIDAYQRLYALVDPEPARAPVRALLAFRIGRAHVELARHERSELGLDSLSRHGRIWLREALALRPALHQVWFERAQLLELEPADGARNQALVHAYEQYLAGAKDVSADEVPRVTLANARLRELQ